MTTPAIAAIVLAAGGSTRLGEAKQLLRYRGRSLVRHAAETALESGCSPVVVVLGSQADACAEEIAGLPVVEVRNSHWATGMAGSIHAGLDAVAGMKGMVSATLICLCDQPYVSAGTLRDLVTAYTKHGSRIVASLYDGVLGVPALFDATLAGELRALRGDEGARKLFARFPTEVTAVPHAEAALDVDTQADRERLQASDIPLPHRQIYHAGQP